MLNKKTIFIALGVLATIAVGIGVTFLLTQRVEKVEEPVSGSPVGACADNMCYCGWECKTPQDWEAGWGAVNAVESGGNGVGYSGVTSGTSAAEITPPNATNEQLVSVYYTNNDAFVQAVQTGVSGGNLLENFQAIAPGNADGQITLEESYNRDANYYLTGGGKTLTPADFGGQGVHVSLATGICTGKGTNGTCTAPAGAYIKSNLCAPSEIQSAADVGVKGSGPVCVRNTSTISGNSASCVDIANSTCRFVQLDVYDSRGTLLSAVTCWPTSYANCGNNPAPPSATPPKPVSSYGGGGDSPSITTTTTTTPSAQCLDVKAFDANWNQLTVTQLSQLKTGDVVRFTVGGSTTSGSFTKARFKINGVQRPEVTGKRPGADEFYDEYTIPAGTSSFSINAELYHSSLGWF